MKVLILFCMVVVAALAQEEKYPPIPYSFNYKSETEDGGTSSHQESGNGAGQVSGSYTVTDLEGHSRVVEYVADEGGFRASVRTNEPGTANLNPADVAIESAADDGGIAAAYSMAIPPAGAERPAAARPAVSAGAGGRRYVLVPSNQG